MAYSARGHGLIRAAGLCGAAILVAFHSRAQAPSAESPPEAASPEASPPPAPSAVEGPAPSAEPPAPPPEPRLPAPAPPPTPPTFPATLSGEVRGRYYLVHNLYDRNNKHNDDLNLGTEMVRLRGEGKPLDEVTLRFGVFQVHAIGLGSRQVVDFPSVKDEQEREFEVDRAHLEWKPAAHPDLTLTVGRQDILIGNGFLVGDGVRLQELNNLIGYIENNRQDFDALRVDWKPEGWLVTAFASRVPDSEGVRSIRDLYLYGLDVERPLEGGHRPALSLVFARDERPREDLLGPLVAVPLPGGPFPYTLDDANGRTLAVALRSKGPIVPPFGYSVEAARQLGASPSGANDNPLASKEVNVRAWGTDARLLAFLHPERKDFIRLRHVFLSGDEPGGSNGQFDPILENQIVSAVFNAQTNIRAWDLGATVTSVEGWQFHLDLWHMRFDEAYDRVLPFGLARNGRLEAGRELDLVVSRQWSPNWKTDLLAAAFQAGDAWTSDNNNPIGFFTSDDLVWALRLTVTFGF